MGRSVIFALAALVSCREAAVEAPDAAAVERQLTLLEHARAIGGKMRDRRFHTELLAELADAHQELEGEQANALARELLGEAIAEAPKIPGADDRELALSRIAAAQARAGAYDEALSTARSIRGADNRTAAETRVAVVAAAQGQAARAAAIARTITAEDPRNEAYAAAASSAAAVGEIELATKLAAECTRPERRGEARLAIVRALLAKNSVKAAQKVIDSIESGHWKSEANALVALEQYGNGQLERADRTTRAIESSWIQARVYADMAKLAARAGHKGRADSLYEKALSTAEGIHDAVVRCTAVEDLVDRAVSLARVKEAIALIDQCSSRESKNRALAKIARLLARAGSTTEADAMARRIGADPIASADAYGAIARAKAKQGDEGAAMEALASITSLQLRLAPAARVIAESGSRPATSVVLAHLAAVLEADLK